MNPIKTVLIAKIKVKGQFTVRLFQCPPQGRLPVYRVTYGGEAHEFSDLKEAWDDFQWAGVHAIGCNGFDWDTPEATL